MRRRGWKCLFWRLTGVPSVLLVATLGVVPLGAQVAPQSQAGRSLAPAYDAARETTLTGTIQEVVTRRVTGSAAGVHLLMAGPKGAVDAQLGPYLDQETRAALQAGMPAQVVGALENFHGKQVLLARQLVFGGRTVTIRTPRGFLVRAQATGARSPKSEKTAETASKGGAL